MKSLLLACLFILTAACNPPLFTERGEFPDGTKWTHKCWQNFDSYTNSYYLSCETYYNNFGEMVLVDIDIAEEVSDIETAIVNAKAKFYTNYFSLSSTAALKLATLTEDFVKISDRSVEDVADYAQKLYGVNPSDIIAAVAKAQLGDNSKMDEVIQESAINFGTTSENMKEVIKYLHSQSLREYGIEL